MLLIDFKLILHISFSDAFSQFNLSLFPHAVHQHRTALFRYSYPCILKPASIRSIYPTVRLHHDRISASLDPTGITPRQVLQCVYITSQLVLSLFLTMSSVYSSRPLAHRTKHLYNVLSD